MTRTLFNVALNGDEEEAQKLINAGANIEARNKSGQTPLYFAVIRGNLELVKFLVKRGADVNNKYESGKTLLHFAAMKGNLESVKLLVKLGADMNKEDDIKQNLICYVAIGGNVELAKWLVNEGIDFNTSDKSTQIAFFNTVLNKHIEFAKWLISKGVDVNVRNNKGETAFNISKNLEFVRLLISNGTEFERSDLVGKGMDITNHQINQLDHLKKMYEKIVRKTNNFKLEKSMTKYSDMRNLLATSKSIRENKINYESHSLIEHLPQYVRKDIISFLGEVNINIVDKLQEFFIDKEYAEILAKYMSSDKIRVIKIYCRNTCLQDNKAK